MKTIGDYVKAVDKRTGQKTKVFEKPKAVNKKTGDLVNDQGKVVGKSTTYGTSSNKDSNTWGSEKGWIDKAIESSSNKSSSAHNDSAIELMQKELGRERARADQAEADALETSELFKKRVSQFEQSQKENWSNMKNMLGERFGEMQGIIKDVQDQSKRGVDIGGDFLDKAQNIYEKVQDPEERRRALKTLSSMNTKKMEDEAEYQSNINRGQNQNTDTNNNNINADNSLSINNNNTDFNGGKDTNIGEPGVMTEKPANKLLAEFDMNSASGDILALMQDPNASSEDILKASLVAELGTTNSAAKAKIDFLEAQAAKTKEYQNQYVNMLNSHRSQMSGLINDQKDYANAKYKQEEEKILGEKASTMKGLNDKRSRLEGYLKAKLKAEGVLDGTQGINKLFLGAAKYDAMITDTEMKFDDRLNQADQRRTETILGLSTKLLEINQKYDQNIFNSFKESDEKADSYKLKALETAEETDRKNLDTVTNFAQNMIQMREKKKAEMEKAIVEAQEKMEKQAQQLTDDLGYVYSVKDGQIQMLTDEEGQPIATWEREKEQFKNEWNQEKFYSDLNFDKEKHYNDLGLKQEKEQFNQWYKKSYLGIQNSKLAQSEKKIAISELEARRKQYEFESEVNKNASKGSVGWEFSANSGLNFEEPKDRIGTTEDGQLWNFGKECAGAVNDIIGEGIYGSTKESKTKNIIYDEELTPYARNGSNPQIGRTFITGTGKYGHVGIVKNVGEKNGKEGIFIYDVNSDGKHSGTSTKTKIRDNYFIPFESEEYNQILGFGVGVDTEIQSAYDSYAMKYRDELINNMNEGISKLPYERADLNVPKYDPSKIAAEYQAEDQVQVKDDEDNSVIVNDTKEIDDEEYLDNWLKQYM